MPHLFKGFHLQGLRLAQIQQALSQISAASLRSVKEIHIELAFPERGLDNAGSAKDISIEALCPFSHLLNGASSLQTLNLHIVQPCGLDLDPEEIRTCPRWSQLADVVSNSATSRTKSFELTLACEDFHLDVYRDVRVLEVITGHFASIQSLYLDVTAYRSGDEDFREFRLVRLLRIPDINIRGLEANNQLGLAARSGVRRLSLRSESYWSQNEFTLLAFHNLEDLQMFWAPREDTNDGTPFEIAFLTLNAPKLVRLGISVSATGLEDALGPIRSFCEDRVTLQRLTVILSDFECMLREAGDGLGHLASIMSQPGRQFQLQVHQGAPSGLSGASSYHLLSLADELHSNLQSLSIVIGRLSTHANNRRPRLVLPSLTSLTFELYTYGEKSSSIVHWYLDGLELPALKTLVIVLKSSLRAKKVLPIQPINAHLPFLPTCCAIHVEGQAPRVCSQVPRTSTFGIPMKVQS